MTRPSPLTLALLAALALALAAPGRAVASGLSAPNVGTARSGPATVDAAALYWNPALLGFLDRPQLLFGANLIAGDVEYIRDRRAIYQREDSFDFALPIEPENIDGDKSGQADPVSANPLAPAPGLFAAVPFGDTDLTAGFGVYAPYAAILDFDDGGAQRWALQDVTLATVYITPTLTWAPSDTFSVGVGVSAVLGLAELRKQQDFASLGDVGDALERPPINQPNDFGPNAPPGVRELAVTSRPIELYDAFATAPAFHVGIASRPVERLRLSLAYHHEVPLTFVGQFNLDMSDDFFSQDLASQGLAYPRTVQGDATLSLTLPRSLWFGLSYDFAGRFGFDLSVGYVWWSLIQEFDVRVDSPDLAQPDLGLPSSASIALPRDWKDTVDILALGRFQAMEPLELFLSLGYQSAASPDSTIDVASPDGDRVVIGAGGTTRLSETFSLVTDVEMQRILDREVVGSDHDLGNGTYKLTLFSIGAHLVVEL